MRERSKLLRVNLEGTTASPAERKIGRIARSGADIVVLVGASDFDGHFLYISRAGDPRVFLVPTVILRPVLALVGVTVAEPPGP